MVQGDRRGKIKCGYGLLFVEKHDKWLRELLEIGAKKHGKSCGTTFQTSIVKVTALRTFGKHIRQSWAFEQLTGSAVKKQVRQHTSSAGIARFDSALGVLSVRRFL